MAHSTSPGAPLRSLTLSLLMASLLGAPAAALHEDDPKLLDRVPPHPGNGVSPGAYLPKPGKPAVFLGAPAGGSTMSMVSSVGGGSIEFPAQGVTLLSWMTLAQLDPGANTGNDCWGYVSPSGREYALIGLSTGTAFVDLADPSDPQLVSFQAGPPSLWRDVKTFDHYAYSVSEGGGGIQVFDLGAIDSGVVSLANTITSGGTSSTHNVAIDTDSGYLYRCGGASDTGLRIYNLNNNPASPQYVGSWHGRYVHDVQVVTYTTGPNAGKQIAFACGGFGNGSVQTGLTILDVTNKNNPQVKAQLQYAGGRYSHQAWLSADRQHLFLDDELDENGVLPTTTHVIDVANLSSPQYAGSFTNGNTAIGHNLYTLGDRLFEANYRSGLRVFDISTPESGVEIASFDTWPGDDHDSFNGLWSCYPYFPSGLVIGSDLEKGLFVWWVGTPALAFDLVGGAPDLVKPAGEGFDVQITESSPGELVAGTAKLYLDDGSGLAEYVLTILGGSAYRVDFPQSACGAELRWFLGARSQSGALWTLPAEAPFTSYSSLSGDADHLGFFDDMEQGPGGWLAGAPTDTATSGIWELGDPIGGVATPDDDHTPTGTLCWQTGLNSDVDDGSTSLTSPRIDLLGWTDPILDFWLWFSKNEGTPQPPDKLRILVSSDDGGNWTLLESLNADAPAPRASWKHQSYHLASFVPLTSTMRVRFTAIDTNSNSIIEAAVDDFRVREALCGCGTSTTCAGAANSVGSGVALSVSGSPSIASNDLVLQAQGGVPAQFGVFFYGPSSASIPFGDGTLCVAGGTYRLQPPKAFDGNGALQRSLDLTQAPASSGAGQIFPGSTWHFQLWYRDPQGPLGTGFNLSGGLQADFCP